ncbi:hypothetical protein L1887_62764 [Cichorium endivia]|nr:hypothetical protein L1887_62764 [Cichorium endivia]
MGLFCGWGRPKYICSRKLCCRQIGMALRDEMGRRGGGEKREWQGRRRRGWAYQFKQPPLWPPFCAFRRGHLDPDRWRVRVRVEAKQHHGARRWERRRLGGTWLGGRALPLCDAGEVESMRVADAGEQEEDARLRGKGDQDDG